MTSSIIGFVAGTKYQQGKSTFNGPGQFMGPNGSGIGNRRLDNNSANGNRVRINGGQIIGTISAQDENSVTVKTPDGGSKIVIISGTTNFNKSTEGSKSDLKVGDRIAIFGNSNSDGTVSAQNIQINPTFRNFGEQTISPSPTNPKD